MADDDALERRVHDLERGHDLTRWYTGRVDRDLAEIATTQIDHTRRLDSIEAKQQEHDGRFDSLDAQMRSLTQMMGQVLERLPEPGQNGD